MRSNIEMMQDAAMNALTQALSDRLVRHLTTANTEIQTGSEKLRNSFQKRRRLKHFLDKIAEYVRTAQDELTVLDTLDVLSRCERAGAEQKENEA